MLDEKEKTVGCIVFNRYRLGHQWVPEMVLNVQSIFQMSKKIGVCSYLRIGFWFHRLSATKSAIKAMLVNRVSDTSLMISIILVWWYLGSTDFSVMLATTQQAYYLDWICATMLIGAMGKSAQIGLHVWLADAMEGPTPVSALIHAATLVTAGVYLIARTGYLWECSANMRAVLTVVGCLTSFMAATCGFFQNDMKRVIAYSTCSQLGYMMVALGLCHYSLAIYHLMTHACFKALLFLSAGVVIHAVSDVQDVRRHGGIQSLLPWTWSTLLLGSLCIAGMPFLSGFYSKDAILELSWSSMQPEAYLAYYGLVIVALFTSYYSFRLLWCSFVSSNSSFKTELPEVGITVVMWLPLLILSLGSILAGYIMSDMLIGFGTDFWHGSIISSPASGEWVSSHFIPSTISLFLPLCSTLLGMVLATAYSWPLPQFCLPFLKNIYIYFYTRWQFDFVYNQQVVFPVISWGSITWCVLDKGVLEILGPTGISNVLVNYYVPLLRSWQTGVVHDYALMYKFSVLVGLCLVVFPTFSVVCGIQLNKTIEQYNTVYTLEDAYIYTRTLAVVFLLLWASPR